MTDQAVADVAKVLVKKYLDSGIDPDFADKTVSLADVPDDDDFTRVCKEADEILAWLGRRFDTALRGAR